MAWAARTGTKAKGKRALVEMKLEVVVVPVADVDRAKDFYTGLGWREDANFSGENGFRVVQLTPPGSACSIISVPGSPPRRRARPTACS
jgi:catechol 2,3-dioxygenase-like lactoylglutathione lyase family enzyme